MSSLEEITYKRSAHNTVVLMWGDPKIPGIVKKNDFKFTGGPWQHFR
jgi:hypothetical protein